MLKVMHFELEFSLIYLQITRLGCKKKCDSGTAKPFVKSSASSYKTNF